MSTFGSEVKSCCSAACLVTPVDCALAVGVLIVVQHAVGILTGVPVLTKGHQGNCAVDVLPDCLTSCIPQRRFGLRQPGSMLCACNVHRTPEPHYPCRRAKRIESLGASAEPITAFMMAFHDGSDCHFCVVL